MLDAYNRRRPRRQILGLEYASGEYRLAEDGKIRRAEGILGRQCQLLKRTLGCENEVTDMKLAVDKEMFEARLSSVP